MAKAAKTKEEKAKTKSKAEKTKINYTTLSLEELKKSEEDLRKELFEMRVKLKTASLPNIGKITQNRRNIARILTELKQRAANEHK